MATYEFLPLNLKLNIEIGLQSGTKPILGVGRVAWVTKAAFSEQYEAGVEFVDLNQEDKMQIADFVMDKATEAL